MGKLSGSSDVLGLVGNVSECLTLANFDAFSSVELNKIAGRWYRYRQGREEHLKEVEDLVMRKTDDGYELTPA